AHVLHRIEKIEGDRITFAGDGNYKIKEVATRQDIVAVMVAVKRASGRRVECSGKSWRWQSRAWLMLPAFVRRVILGIRRRLIA
ncbi:MAG: peptidase S41, partial [Alistipes sp.]|nr:peptidase S41 [Alistipes sp.]